MDEYRLYKCVAETIGVECELIGVDEIKNFGRWQTQTVWSVCHHHTDGHVAPVDLTMALARGARDMGGKIHQYTVVDTMERDGSEWVVSWHDYKNPEIKGQIRCGARHYCQR